MSIVSTSVSVVFNSGAGSSGFSVFDMRPLFQKNENKTREKIPFNSWGKNAKNYLESRNVGRSEKMLVFRGST